MDSRRNNMITKLIDSLLLTDIRSQSVWEFTNSDDDETAVIPVLELPVSTLSGRIVSAQAALANGSDRWALIGNIDVNNANTTEQFLTLTIFDHDKSFTLARYFDADIESNGPQALAKFLNLAEKDVFPIKYNISHVVQGNREVVIGSISSEPRIRLSRSELIALSLK
jgi:hypothetical protein